MSVLAIGYDWGSTPPIVRMEVDDNLATLTTAGYFNGAAIQAEIEALNNGAFDVADGTVFLIDYSDGEGFFALDTVNGTFSAETGDVVLPTRTNFIAHFTGADGTISSEAANVINEGDIQAGIDASAGKFVSFPATTNSGTLEVVGVNNSADVAVTISNASHAQASVYSIPDGGQATSEFIIADSAGTQHITSGGFQVDAGIVSSGLAAGGFIGRFDAYSTTAGNGILSLAAVDAGGDFDTVISNAGSVGQDQVITIPDSGASTANFLLDDGAANILAHQQFVGIESVLTFGTGTWTVTRIARGDYVSRHTPGDETSVIAIDITPMIRVAASKGFRLDSFDYIYSIAALAMDAHTVTLDRIEYADNVAVSVNSIAITGALATATQANPYVTNVAVDTPAFDNTADSKYVIEVTANNSATSEYDFYGVMLRFSQTIG